MKKNELSEGLPAFVNHLLNCQASIGVISSLWRTRGESEKWEME